MSSNMFQTTAGRIRETHRGRNSSIRLRSDYLAIPGPDADMPQNLREMLMLNDRLSRRESVEMCAIPS